MKRQWLPILSRITVGAALLLPALGCPELVMVHQLTASEKTTDIPAEKAGAAKVADAKVIDQPSRESSLKQRIGRLFANVYSTVNETRELVDRHESLPDRSYNPFRTDKQSNRAEMNELLDEAIEMLQVSEVSECRQQIRDVHEAIHNSHSKIAEYRRKRISAPEEQDLGRVDKLNPFVTTREAYDEMINLQQQEIKTREQQLVEVKATFVKELRAIGLNVDAEGAETLLASVSGDDLVSMAIVFDNIKQLTIQLQELTVDSGEALDEAKRYYGMYFVLVKVIDRIQKTFVDEIHAVHIPKLHEYSQLAKQNIDQANALIKVNGGDAAILRSNIVSNELTQKTAEMYVTFLEDNAKLITQENHEVEKSLATAMNTYKTVKLSSDVAALMKTGRQSFDTLMKLRLPAMREFENDSIRREFTRMTEELRAR